MQLFKLFWPDNRLKKIVVENNRYARVVDAEGKTKGGPTWENITVATLKAFIAIFLYFGMKRQPNEKSYWYKVSFIIPFNLFFIQRLPHK
jgi:bacteriorhodopsin